MKTARFQIAFAALTVLAVPTLAAQTETTSATNRAPDLRELLSAPQSEMRVVSQRYQSDRGNLNRYHNLALSPGYFARFKSFYSDWLAAVKKIDPSKFSEDG